MKLLYTFLAFFCILPAAFACPRQERVSGAVKQYQYLRMGTMATPQLFIDVYRDESGRPLIAYLHNSPIVLVYEAPEDIFERIREMVRSHRLRRLKRDYMPTINILDGWTWNLWIYYEKGMIVSAGFNASPSAKMEAGMDAINGYIKDCTVEREPIDRLPYRTYRGWDK